MFLAKVFYIISQKFNAALFLVLTLIVLFLICLEGGFFFPFSLFFYQQKENCLKLPQKCGILGAVLLPRKQNQVRKKRQWNRKSAVYEGYHGVHHNTSCWYVPRGVSWVQKGLPFHQLLQLVGSAPGLASAGGKCDETQPRTASKMQVWELESPELPWYCGAGFLMCGYRDPLESQFLHLLQHLGGMTWPKLSAYYQCLMLPLAAVTDVVSTSLTLFFWQPLLMMFLEGNPLENCLFHSLLPLSAHSAANIKYQLLFLPYNMKLLLHYSHSLPVSVTTR